MRALLLPVGEDVYAVPLARVREVLSPLRVTPVPLAPGTVLGVVNVRGEVVPVLDTGALLGVRPVGHTGTVAAAVVDTERGPAALAASGEPAVETLGEDLGPSDLAAAAGRRRASPGVATLLDVEAACAADRIGAGG